MSHGRLFTYIYQYIYFLLFIIRFIYRINKSREECREQNRRMSFWKTAIQRNRPEAPAVEHTSHSPHATHKHVYHWNWDLDGYLGMINGCRSADSIGISPHSRRHARGGRGQIPRVHGDLGTR